MTGRAARDRERRQERAREDSARLKAGNPAAGLSMTQRWRGHRSVKLYPHLHTPEHMRAIAIQRWTRHKAAATPAPGSGILDQLQPGGLLDAIRRPGD